MLRGLGVLLILCGGLMARHTLLAEERNAQRTRRALAEAFDGMAAEIRLLLTPLPVLLSRDWGRGAAGFFSAVSDALKSGEELREAWRNASAGLPLQEKERESIAAMADRLTGGEESACAALNLTASILRRNLEAADVALPARERLVTATCVSISLFLSIFLL